MLVAAHFKGVEAIKLMLIRVKLKLPEFSIGLKKSLRGPLSVSATDNKYQPQSCFTVLLTLSNFCSQFVTLLTKD